MRKLILVAGARKKKVWRTLHMSEIFTTFAVHFR